MRRIFPQYNPPQETIGRPCHNISGLPSKYTLLVIGVVIAIIRQVNFSSPVHIYYVTAMSFKTILLALSSVSGGDLSFYVVFFFFFFSNWIFPRILFSAHCTPTDVSPSPLRPGPLGAFVGLSILVTLYWSMTISSVLVMKSRTSGILPGRS
ncbi:hypothetical protein M405DRAFT_76083 [Rhizopogon salebrosus TDB-379]|nr:hypothetical protein M405DRAFT_76083 [Rhizopogon salebrosus TDB-379]